MRFEEALCLYENHMRSLNMSERTVGNRCSGLQSYGKFLGDIGIEDVTEVTPKVLEQYRTHLFESKNKCGDPLAVGSQIQKLCALNRLYETLVERGVVLVNLAAKMPMPRKPHHLPKRLPTVKEVERLLSRMPMQTPRQFRDRAILETFYATGVRQAELSGTKTAAVDFGHRELYVIGKGLKDRTLPLTDRCAGCLEVYIKEVKPSLPESPWLFPSRSGGRLENSTLLNIVDDAATKAKLKFEITTHTFRHLLATELLRRGASMRAIQEYLGHASVETTTRYAQVLGKDLKAVHSKTHPHEMEVEDGNK